MGAEAFTVAGGAQIVGVTTPEPGVAEVRVIASDTPGDDRIGIRLTAGSGPSVRLMPDAGVRVIADIADFNDDGQTNFFDLRDYLIAFGQQDPAADLNDDGAINFVDLSVFIDLFKAP
jgi:hypothetical protein